MTAGARAGDPEGRPASSVVVALDAMGGDHAPAACVRAAVRAHAADGIAVLLVGDPVALAPHLRGAAHGPQVVAADAVVGMDEDPAIALRSKPGASIRVAIGLLASGRAQAVVSAGSTGATLAASLLGLGRVHGVRRPVVAARIPSAQGHVVLVDAGGSPDVQPDALVAHARMGAAYAAALGRAAPRVGLLNVGAELGKGNALARAAGEALATVEGFVGNVEPGPALAGVVDVVVTDAFTGNIFLKTLEAAAVSASGRDPAKRATDHAAVLLGVKGTVLVAHGAAGAAELATALSLAARVASAGVVERIAAHLRDGGTQEPVPGPAGSLAG